MKHVLQSLRTTYFQKLVRKIDSISIQFIILTHILEDRPEVIEAINTIAPISLIIAIPYSKHSHTLAKLISQYKIATPTLEELSNKKYLKNIITSNISANNHVVIVEIGGYFAKILRELSNELGNQLLGIIEDTEHGHREYEKLLNNLPCPIVSVARSELKDAEDFLVGASCLFSTEKLLRKAGFPIEGRNSLVMGFGKVGQGMAHALMRRHCPVTIYDIDPIKRIKAISEGFKSPSKLFAFKQTNIIYGTTGNCSIKANDFAMLPSGTILVSCSSKKSEFELRYLAKRYRKTPVLANNFDCYENDGHILYLLAQGQPINFIDGAVIGPILTLVQSEIFLAIERLIKLQGHKGLFELDKKSQQFLANTWLNYFCDETSGHYKHV